MVEPKVVKVIGKHDPLLKDLLDTTQECIIQNREPGDESLIVYIPNPKYEKGVRDDITKSAPYIALTQYDYEVIEWTT
jgi:hypothetical protein